MNKNLLHYTYHHYNTIITGAALPHALYDYSIQMNITSPLWITFKNKKMQKLHSSIFTSPYTTESETFNNEEIDALIVCGGKREIEKGETLVATMKRRPVVIHIPFGSLTGDEYTHHKGANDLIIFDTSLYKKGNAQTIAQRTTVMLFYLFASTLENPHSFSLLSLRYSLSQIVTITSLLKQHRQLNKASYISATLLPIVGEVHSNIEKSSLISLMEHMVVENHSTLYQSSATLLLPLVLYIKETAPDLYLEIQKGLGNENVEDFCRSILNISPLGKIQSILKQTIVQVYSVIQQEGAQASFHQFLTFIDKEETEE